MNAATTCSLWVCDGCACNTEGVKTRERGKGEGEKRGVRAAFPSVARPLADSIQLVGVCCADSGNIKSRGVVEGGDEHGGSGDLCWF